MGQYSNSVRTIMGPFDADRMARLRDRCRLAQERNELKFSFEGAVWVTAFAEYMLEYLAKEIDHEEGVEP